jgi:hypothetical protein
MVRGWMDGRSVFNWLVMRVQKVVGVVMIEMVVTIVMIDAGMIGAIDVVMMMMTGKDGLGYFRELCRV